ncbi:MAG: alpha/beta hydrolase [Propionibacteriaceae bacterium]|jgi:acetyl esterase|nr:alpha/beta hydrolase [Propionibacteriaceae bacterium]
MAIDQIIKQAHRDARKIAGKTARTPSAWREQALRVDREVTAPRMAPAPEAVVVRQAQIDVPGRSPVEARVYIPSGQRRRAAFLSFFGGAFKQGRLDFPSIDISNRTRAHEADVVVVAVEYALAPEHRYPEAVEQGQAALEWLRANADSVMADPDRLALGGQSSGGGIAAAVALLDRDRGGPPLQLQLLEVPALDLTGGHLARKAAWQLGIPPVLMARGLKAVARDYLGDPALARQPYASPLLAEDLSGLPAAHIFTAEFDVFRGDGKAYAQRLEDAGVPATLHEFAGQTHDSAFYTAVLPAARQWQAEVWAALRAL